MINQTEIERVLEILRRRVHKGQYTLGGAMSGPSGFKSWGNEKIMEIANPDGSAAIQLINALVEEIEKLNKGLTRIANRDFNSWSANPYEWPCTIAKQALGIEVKSYWPEGIDDE